ncbi:hypothetical protein FQA39_LY13820 [Lamprigera yunnana]|nr:hypothetical protein FQA39_LY13820 [Lamprigera yunnana]
MTLNSVPLNIYFHMANHYKKLQKVKSVIDNSAPVGYEKSQGGRRSRPPSRVSSLLSAKSRTSNSSDRYYNDFNESKKRERSRSVPVRPTTRRKHSAMHNVKQETVIECQTFARPNNNHSNITNNTSKGENDNKNKSLSAPKKNKNEGYYLYKERDVDEKYLIFSLRIMEDILRTRSFTNSQMREVFQIHLKANSGHLDHDKMMKQINNLKIQLKIPNESDDEHETSSSEKTSSIPNASYFPSTTLNSDLKCECSVVRCLALCSKDTAKRQKTIEVFNSSSCTQLIEEYGTDNTPDVSVSTILDPVLEKSEHTSFTETTKISKDANDNVESKDGSIIENLSVPEVTEDNINCDLFSTSNVGSYQENDVLLTALGDHHPSVVLTKKDLTNDAEVAVLKEKVLALTEPGHYKLHTRKDPNKQYILIPGPLFVPEMYIDQFRTINIENCTTPNNDKYLLITKDIAVNTSETTQNCQCNLVYKKNKNYSNTDINKDIVSKDFINNYSNKNDLCDLNCYDLPQRDVTETTTKNLLLGDEYEIKKVYSSIPLVLREFYPSTATQTSATDVSKNDSIQKINTDDLALETNLPSSSNNNEQSMYNFQEPRIEMYESPDWTSIRSRLSSLSNPSQGTSLADSLIHAQLHNLTDVTKNVKLKSNLKNRLNFSDESEHLPSYVDDEKKTKRHPTKNVSISLNPSLFPSVRETKETNLKKDVKQTENEWEPDNVNGEDNCEHSNVSVQQSILMTVEKVTKDWETRRPKPVDVSTSFNSMTQDDGEEMFLKPSKIDNNDLGECEIEKKDNSIGSVHKKWKGWCGIKSFRRNKRDTPSGSLQSNPPTAYEAETDTIYDETKDLLLFKEITKSNPSFTDKVTGRVNDKDPVYISAESLRYDSGIPPN